MTLIEEGKLAPPIAGIELGGEPVALFFYKVTCPVCQMAAPMVEHLERAYPGHVVGVGQDPPSDLRSFADAHGMTFRSIEDPPPYTASDAYGLAVVPTTVLVGADGTVVQAVEAWDREGLNGLSERLASLTGEEYVPISDSGDGLPPFRPG